jgi:regulator of protease activity HflC (stomatin/prohibitin superfamily)
MASLFVVLVVAAFLLAKAVIRLPPGQVYIPARLGKALPPLHAGLHFIVPLIDTIAARYSLEMREIPVRDTFRSVGGENVAVEMTARYRILDSDKAFRNISDVENSVRNLLAASIKNEAAGRKSDDFRFESRSIESAVTRKVDDAAEQFGVKVIECTLK